MNTYDVIVVGGGAAGMMAAGQAADLGARTLLLEKMDQPGRKIFITGKFRCNLTNTAPIPEFIDHFGTNGRFLRQAFHRFFQEDLVRFFHELGVPTVTERGGRVFPASGRSQEVVQALVSWCHRCGVTVKTYAPVEALVIQEGSIRGVRTAESEFQAKAVIVATGGASYPGTGSTGDGFRLAGEAGHKITPIYPALVPLTTKGDTAQKLQGLSLRNVVVTVTIHGGGQQRGFGEMLFTHFGVSGPVILTLSRQVVQALENGKSATIAIDLKPALDDQKLEARLLRDLDQQGKKHFQTMLKGLLPSKMIPVCIELTGIPGDKLCHQVTSEERKRLHNFLKDLRLEVDGHRGFRHAVVTAGGVDLREIDPRTMESRLVQGLYFAGEVLDLDADTGGYNLQAAFSTGWLAGRSAAQPYGD